MATASVNGGDMKWTGGAGDGKWESKDNWDPKGPPTENDDVVIPKNSGKITTDGTEKKVKSLTVEDSDPALEPQFPRTKITADGSGKSVKITAKGEKGITIGAKNEVRGADGKDGRRDPDGNGAQEGSDTEDGGNAELDAPGGKVTNKGNIEGGKGGEGDSRGTRGQRSGGKGGAVRVSGKEIENTGTEIGGNGGNGKNEGGKGGEGGGVYNDSKTDGNRPGGKTGGTGGKHGASTKKADNGKVVSFAPFRIEFPFDFFSFEGQRGDSIILQTGPEGGISLAGLGAGAFVAEDTVTLDAGGPDNPIDLRGIPAGTKVIVASNQVALRGLVLLDPGVRLEDIIDTDLIVLLPPQGGSVRSEAEVIHLGRNHTGSLDSQPVGGFTLIGGGNDAWDNFDECTFAAREVAGDFDIQVRVESLEANSRWTKAGLMVRESLSESARMVFNRVTPPPVPTSDGDLGANDSRFAYRTGLDEAEKGGGVNGGRHEDGEGAPEYPNAWLRVQRVGSVISGYRSTDGVNWILQGSQDTATWAGGPLPEKVLVGPAVSKGPFGGPTATAHFQDCKITLGTNQPVFRLLSASSEGNPTGIKVVFARPLRDDGTDLWHWAISPGMITNAQFGATLDTVLLETATPLVEGRTYTLTFDPNTDKDALQPDFFTVSFVHGAGYDTRRIAIQRFNHLPGPSMDLVLSSSAYARDLADVTYSNTLFEDTTPEAQNDFSGRIFGVLNITNAGLYRFFACSDDSSRLYLGTDDQPANKIEIAREPEWNGPRQYATTDRRGASRANVSAPVRLEAGKRYWLEQVFADGSQGNNASVAWQPPGATEPGNGALPIPESAFVRARYFKGTVFYTLGKPVFIEEPMSQTVSNGQVATFTVRVDGTPPYSYQWQQGSSAAFEDIPGATNAGYAHLASWWDIDKPLFRCVVSNPFSSATSAVATLTVLGCDLRVTQQPADATVFAGQTATFSVGATGTPDPATYQWQQSGPGSDPFTNLPPATGPTLTLTASAMDNGTKFRCVIGNDCTTVVSDAATLMVVPPPPAHDFAALGLSLTPLASGLYEAAPQVEISIGSGATNPVPLDFLLTVNGELRFDGRGAEMVALPPDGPGVCDDSDCLNKLCYVATSSGTKEGACSSDCLCTVTVTFAAVPLALSPGDVVQLILDPDHRVPELDEGDNTFTLTVPNHPPVLAPIPPVAVHAGSRVRFAIAAWDEDSRQTLTFALDGAPPGASIDSTTGEFSWPTGLADSDTTHEVVVRVTDNGARPLSAVSSFSLRVAPPPVIQSARMLPDGLELVWRALPGNSYHIEGATDLGARDWTELVSGIVTLGEEARWVVPRVPSASQAFFRVGAVPGIVVAQFLTAASTVTNQPAWTCCEANIRIPMTGKLSSSGSTGTTNNDTRRWVEASIEIVVAYDCNNVPDQLCVADLAAKVVFRPRQADAGGDFVNDPEEELIATVRGANPPKCDGSTANETRITIRWRGTYRTTRNVKGTLHVELSVPARKGTVNHTLSVDVESSASTERDTATNPTLKERPNPPPNGTAN
jgi:hypothetical protein